MLSLFPISWMFSLIMLCYATSGQAHSAPRAPHSQLSKSNSTVRTNQSVARPSSQINTLGILSNSVTAASNKSLDIGSCPQDNIDDELCALVVGDVDIYFWPDPSRDRSCLSIVGNATNPPMQGALTSTIYGPFYNNSITTTVYWGCTALDPSQGASFITTAVLVTTGSLSAKKYLYNPWSSQPCSSEALRSTSPLSQPLEARGAHVSGHVRRHTLRAPSEITQESGVLSAKVTSGDFTFTSPSIYVNFHQVSVMEVGGADVCASFSIPMLSFSPGELSTIEGLHWDSSLPPFPGSGQTKVFNFADLPCPPQSVMEANWYKPEPGQPYRPLIVLPKQVYAWNPAFRNCDNFAFEGYDPPKALVPATAMAPIITQAEPLPSSMPPTPSATPDPGPKETNHVSVPKPASTQGLQAPQAQQTSALESESGVQGSGPSPVALSPDNVGIRQDEIPSSLNHQIGTNADPGQKADPSFSPINNANENSAQNSYPEQTSQGKTDTDFDQGAVPTSDPSKGGHDNSGQVGQQADSSQTAEQKQAKGGLENDSEPWKAPESTPVQQGNIIAIDSQKPGQTATVNGHIVQVFRNAISIAGTTLSAGAPPITVSGTPIALGSGSLVVGSVSVQITLPPSSLATGQVTTLNEEVFKQLPTGISVAGSILTPGAPGIMVSGSRVSLGPSSLIIGSISIPVTLSLLPWTPGPMTNITGEVIRPQNKDVQAFQGSANALKSRLAGVLPFWLLCACLIQLYLWHY